MLKEGIVHSAVDPETGFEFYYAWNMANQWTFQMPTVKELIEMELANHRKILVPFAGHTRFPEYGNAVTYIEIHPDMPKPYIQGDVVDVLPLLIKKNARFDLIISDPPYTYFQSTRTYGSDKKKRHQMITPIKEMYDALLVPGGDIISFGFNSTGMGKDRGYVKKLLLIINSGSGHNDIAITEETKCGKGGDCDIYAIKEHKAVKRKKIAQSQFF